jgi:prepilin-type processing-associated H-X9-DG protein
LKQIGLALHNYHEAHGRFPPAAVYGPDGRALYSWRVLILPYLERSALYNEFHLAEPWDSPHNAKLLARRPSAYDPVGTEADRTMTYSQVFLGAGTAFEGRRGLSKTDFPDGLDTTALVVEAGEPVPWTRPIELPFMADAQLPPVGGVFKAKDRPLAAGSVDGFNVLMADGSVRFLRKARLPERTLRALITRDGGERVQADDL